MKIKLNLTEWGLGHCLSPTFAFQGRRTNQASDLIIQMERDVAAPYLPSACFTGVSLACCLLMRHLLTVIGQIRLSVVLLIKIILAWHSILMASLFWDFGQMTPDYRWSLIRVDVSLDGDERRKLQTICCLRDYFDSAGSVIICRCHSCCFFSTVNPLQAAPC